MPIRFFSGKKRRPPSKIVRPTRARDEALQKQMAKAFSVNWLKGVFRMRQGIDSDTLADAYLSRDYTKLFKNIPFGKFKRLIEPAMDDLGKSAVAGAERGAAFVPKPQMLRYDLANPEIRKYMDTRQGFLIEGVNDEFHLTVQNLIKSKFARGGSVAGLQAGLLEPTERHGVAGRVLRNSLGLDTRSANALAARSASGKYTQEQLDAYENELHARRALLIANTETSYALNEGQRLVWDAAAEQGLIDPDVALKVWVVDGNPCPVCIQLDGVAVGLRDEFISPDGLTVPGPPLHPRCMCVATLAPDGDLENAGNSNRQNYES